MMTMRFRTSHSPGRVLAVALLAFFGLPALAELDLEYHESDHLEPQVQLKEYQNRSVEEYRINGNLYMIKIKPRFGPAYYLVDDTGTGELDLRRDSGGRDIIVPRWTLLTW